MHTTTGIKLPSEILLGNSSIGNSHYRIASSYTFEKKQTPLKAEKYIITTEGMEPVMRITRMGFGVAGEEVQKYLSEGHTKVLVHVVGPERECAFSKEKDKDWRLHDIKQRIKNLTAKD